MRILINIHNPIIDRKVGTSTRNLGNLWEYFLFEPLEQILMMIPTQS